MAACSRGGEGGGPLARLRVVPFPQLGAELQQPGEAVGPLEGVAPLAGQVAGFEREVGGRQALGQGGARPGGEGRLGKQPRQARQQPVAVHGGMPVVAAVKGGREFAGRLHVGIRIERVGDLVRILLVNAVERQAGEARGLRLVEIGSGHENSGEQRQYREEPGHVSMVSEAGPGPPASSAALTRLASARTV